jgi:excisionase family DNA binding protein
MDYGGFMTKLIGAQEVAERLDVPPSWVYRWSREGKLPSVKLGKYLKFDPKKIEEWIGDQTKEGI